MRFSLTLVVVVVAALVACDDPMAPDAAPDAGEAVTCGALDLECCAEDACVEGLECQPRLDAMACGYPGEACGVEGLRCCDWSPHCVEGLECESNADGGECVTAE
jgi:hypothetical protein